MESLAQLMVGYAKEGLPHLRLGQYFVGKYIKNTWTELFYEEDKDKAFIIIKDWLSCNQYLNVLPEPVDSWKVSQEGRMDIADRMAIKDFKLMDDF